MKIKLVILFIFISTSVQAEEYFQPYDATDYYLQTVLIALIYLDMKETIYLLQYDGYYELNPILGEHPSEETIRRHAVGIAVIHSLYVWFLPKEYRSYFQAFSLGAESATVWSNYQLMF